LEKKVTIPFYMLFCNCLFKGACSSWVVVAIAIVGEIQAFVFLFWIDNYLRI
jgi:putative component of membrane protein insertase Oxa1/YidC/SpoIIIJ protein YidD